MNLVRADSLKCEVRFSLLPPPFFRYSVALIESCKSSAFGKKWLSERCKEGAANYDGNGKVG